MKILYIDIDTLRPDHLGCYGYSRNTSPNIDKIASQGVKFENYYCSDAPCLPSRTALVSSKFGIHTGVVNHGGLAADMKLEGADRYFTGRLSYESLPGVLRTKRLKTVTISPFADRHGSWTFYAGFTEIYDTGKKGMESAEEITPIALKWLKDNAKSDNWFLHINYWDPHVPFRVPIGFGNPFKEELLNTWITKDILEEHRNMVGPNKPRELSMYDNQIDKEYPRQLGEIRDMDDLKIVIDGYDTSIRYVDYHVGIILDFLNKQRILDDTIIIISADHGESYGELGIYAEHATADYPTCRIPLIVKWPGMKKGHIDNGLHYNIDLLPTIAELLSFKSYKMLGIDEEQYTNWDGTSFAAVLTRGIDCSREYLVLSHCAHACQRSVRYSDWLYIRTYHDGYHLFDREMLFNIKDDPYEQINLESSRRNIIKEANQKLDSWYDEMMSSNECKVDPLKTVLEEGGPFHSRGQLKKYCEYLKKTNRGSAIEELRRRHPEEFKN